MLLMGREAWNRGFFTLQEIAFLQSKKRSARMHTAAYKVDVASDRRRRENAPRHILFCNRMWRTFLIYAMMWVCGAYMEWISGC